MNQYFVPTTVDSPAAYRRLGPGERFAHRGQLAGFKTEQAREQALANRDWLMAAEWARRRAACERVEHEANKARMEARFRAWWEANPDHEWASPRPVRSRRVAKRRERVRPAEERQGALL